MKIAILSRALAFTLAGLCATPLRAADAPRVLFEEEFSGHLDAGWKWIHERPDAWRLENGALIVDTLPGSYWKHQNSAQNTLLRPAPASLKDGFILEVLLDNEPRGQFEHAGLICYFDGETIVAMNKEFIGKQRVLLFSQQDGNPTVGPEKEYGEREVWLRLTVRGTKATGQYRSSEKDPWQTLGEVSMPASTKDLQVGFQSGYGLEKPERRARFRNFRILAGGE